MARVIDLESIESEQVVPNTDLLHLVDVSPETSEDKKITVAKLLNKSPDAGSDARGFVNTNAQTFAGVKSFAGGIIVDNIKTSGNLDLTSFTRFVVVSEVPELANMQERVLYLVNTVGDIYQGYYLIINGTERSRGQIGGRSYTGGTGISVNNTTAEIVNTLATQGGTLNGNTEVEGDLTINGDIYQNGSAYETHAEKLYTKKDLIITRDGAQSPLANDEYTGICAKHYDLQGNDGILAFDKTGTARVGDYGEVTVFVYSTDGETFYTDSEMTEEAVIPSGVTPEPTSETNQYEYTTLVDDTEPILTRKEEADMQDSALMKWNGTDKNADTIAKPVYSNTFLKATVNQTTGAVTYSWEEGGSKGVAFIGTRAEYEVAKLIPFGETGYIPSGSQVIITNENSYIKGENR